MSKKNRSAAPATDSSTPQGVVVYTRVSTARQAAEGVGLAAQREACEAEARRRGLQVLATYSDDGISGREGLDGRPGLVAALAHCKRAGAPLVVYAVSRLSRRQRLLWELLDERGEHQLALISATEPFDTASPIGRAMLGMLAVWSQLEGDMIRSRTRDALAAARAEGRKLGAPRTFDVDPVLAGRIVKLHEAGKSFRSIADKLNEEKVQGIRGGKWWPRTVRAVFEQVQAA